MFRSASVRSVGTVELQQYTSGFVHVKNDSLDQANSNVWNKMLKMQHSEVLTLFVDI